MSTRVSFAGRGLMDRAEAAAEKAIQAVMRELFAAFQQSFTAKAWNWPQDTVRFRPRTFNYRTKAGKIVVKTRGRRTPTGRAILAGNPRNIIDYGNLRQSGYWEFVGPYTARFTWSAQYAQAVHEGYRRFRKDGSYSTWPARPWTRAVLGQVTVPGIRPFPFEQRLKEVWLAYFRASRP